MKYSLAQINSISFNGFEFNVPPETIDLITMLAKQVGSPSYIKTPTFHKRENITSNVNEDLFKTNRKRKCNNRNEIGNMNQISNNEWEGIKTIQNNKIETKTEFDTQIDTLRLSLNKLTDKTFLVMREKIITLLNTLLNQDEELCEDNNNKLGFTIYDILSNNKFYSKIYSGLFTELITVYPHLKTILDNSFTSYLEQFHNLEFVDPNQDYDRFCELNKINEKRKSRTMFFLNLSFNGVIPLQSIGTLLQKLLQLVFNLIDIEDKKPEVDEITEHIAILFTNEFTSKLENTIDYESNNYNVNKHSFGEVITEFAKSKSKDYKSLSAKAIFKYMDLIEI